VIINCLCIHFSLPCLLQPDDGCNLSGSSTGNKKAAAKGLALSSTKPLAELSTCPAAKPSTQAPTSADGTSKHHSPCSGLQSPVCLSRPCKRSGSACRTWRGEPEGSRQSPHSSASHGRNGRQRSSVHFRAIAVTSHSATPLSTHCHAWQLYCCAATYHRLHRLVCCATALGNFTQVARPCTSLHCDSGCCAALR